LPDHDRVLEDTFKKAGNVVTGFVLTTDEAATRHIPVLSHSIAFGKGTEEVSRSAYYNVGVITNLVSLEEAAAGNGVFTSVPDVDGLIRRVPMFYKITDGKGGISGVYPSLALEALRVAEDPRGVHKIRKMKEGDLKNSYFAPAFQLKTGKNLIPLNATGWFLCVLRERKVRPVYFGVGRFFRGVAAGENCGENRFGRNQCDRGLRIFDLLLLIGICRGLKFT
jgi:adenylate cyclase